MPSPERPIKAEFEKFEKFWPPGRLSPRERSGMEGVFYSGAMSLFKLLNNDPLAAPAIISDYKIFIAETQKLLDSGEKEGISLPKFKAQLTIRCECGHTWKVQGDAVSGQPDFIDEIVCEKCGEVGEVVNCEEEED